MFQIKKGRNSRKGSLDPITGDIMNIVPLSMWQYAPNTKKLNYNKTRLRKVENWLTVFSLHFVKMHPNFHLSYGSLVRKYKNVMIMFQKEQEHSLKIRVFFKSGIKSLSTCLPVSIEIVPPFSTTVQTAASHQAIQKCFRVRQSQCPRVDI